MNYSYDIVLNYTPISSFIEFYEWRREDTLTYIQKIPIFYISDIQMKEMMDYTFVVSKEFLKKIEEETLTEKGNISYSFLVTDQSRVIAFLLNDEGESIEKSSLLLDEEDTILEEMIFSEMMVVPYQKQERIHCPFFLTREERNIQKTLLEKLNSLWKEKNYDEIHYLYQEFFHDPLTIKEKYQYLKEKIKNHYQSQYQKLYEIILLAEKEKEKI